MERHKRTLAPKEGLEPKYENEGNTDKGKFYSGETEAVEKTNIIPETIKIKKD